MKYIFYFCLLALCLPVLAQNGGTSSESKFPETDSTWPGIKMQIPEVKRIAGNRLLFVVRLLATDQAPAYTLIGTMPMLPPDATDDERREIRTPAPFSLQGSTMIEEKTQNKYEALTPDPKGPPCLPSYTQGSLSGGQALYLSIQFAAPPPPAPDESGHVPKQTVSLLLPKTRGAIIHIVVPPAPSAVVP